VHLPAVLLLRSHRWIGRHSETIVTAAFLLAAAALLTTLSTARLDLSFRPLFADDADAAAATAAFEAAFGQPSGEWIGALVEHDTGLTDELRARLGQLSAELAALPHVTGVASPATADDDEVVRRGGRLFAVMLRTDLPLEELSGRARLIERLRGGVEAAVPPDAVVHYVGVSVVEAEYARAVPRSMLRSLALTLGAVVALLILLFGRVRDVVIVLAGVAAATPVAMALITLAGGAITMLNSMVPTVLLVVGVADAIHIRMRWEHELRRASPARALRRAFVRMALPCALTTLTTALGFLSLGAARVHAIRAFGFAVAAGVCVPFVANMLVVPALLRRYGAPVTAGDDGARTAAGLRRLRRGVFAPLAHRLFTACASLVVRPALPVTAALIASVFAVVGASRIVMDQRFNEELGPQHPVRIAQALWESEFGGFLGPELEIARADGSPITSPTGDVGRPEAGAAHSGDRGEHAEPEPGTASSDFVSDDVLVGRAAAAARALDRVDAVTALYAGGRAALVVRVPDIGTAAALPFAHHAADVVRAEMGDGFRVRIVGQWYLAQLGMASLLRDMLASFALSALFVLAVLAGALRSRRLFAAAILPNLLPMLAALAFMGWAGITLRIGTTLVLAIVLAIAVDDTIHMLLRLDAERRRGATAEQAVAIALRETGAALVVTTLALAAGFLSTQANELAAIRDMGLVAAVALLAALLADLLVAPALFVAFERPRGGEPVRAGSRRRIGRPLHTRPPCLRHPSPAATSSVGSARTPPMGTLQ
jgi:uncharacterized protein